MKKKLYVSKGVEVMLQFNKNRGLCDMQPRVGTIFSDFQGRQYSNNLFVELKNAILSHAKENL